MSGEGASLNCIPGTDTDCGLQMSRLSDHAAIAVDYAAVGLSKSTKDVRFSNGKPFSLIGEKTSQGWRGRLYVADKGTAVVAAPLLNAEQLRALAAEANRMADLFDERVDW